LFIIRFLTETEEKRHLVNKVNDVREEAISILVDLSPEGEEHLFKTISAIFERRRKLNKWEMVVFLLKLLNPQEKNQLTTLKQ
jgi:hypothetical protein